MAPYNTSATEGVSSRLIVTIIGSLLAFVVIFVGFCAVARKTCCARTSRCEHKHVHTYVGHRGSPIASVDKSKCPRCVRDRLRARVAEGRDDSISISPPPPYTRPPSIASSTITVTESSPSLTVSAVINAGGEDCAASDALSVLGRPPPAYVSGPSRAPVVAATRNRLP